MHVHECAHTLTLPPFEGAIIHNHPFPHPHAMHRHKYPFTSPNTPLHTHTSVGTNTTPQFADTCAPSWVNTHRPQHTFTGTHAWTRILPRWPHAAS